MMNFLLSLCHLNEVNRATDTVGRTLEMMLLLAGNYSRCKMRENLQAVEAPILRSSYGASTTWKIPTPFLEALTQLKLIYIVIRNLIHCNRNL